MLIPFRYTSAGIISVAMMMGSFAILPQRDRERLPLTSTTRLGKADLASIKGGTGCGKCQNGCTTDLDECTSDGLGGAHLLKYYPHRECHPGIAGCVNLGDSICNWRTGGYWPSCNPIGSPPTCPDLTLTCTSTCNT
jgi:hypothetical protein